MSLLQSDNDTKPLPLDPLPSEGSDITNRLWIGQLDSRITEYNLIKLLQKFGTVVNFNFLFHKTGPLQGQPRGYCFVTYETREQAEKALKQLDGKLALSKRLSVKWANSQTMAGLTNGRSPEDGHAKPTNQKDATCTVSISSKIQAIEAKLRMMEENKDHEERLVPILPFLNASNQQVPSTRPQSASLRRRPYPKHIPRRKTNSRVR